MGSSLHPVTRWHIIVSAAAQISMAEMVERVCRDADAEARQRFGPEFFSRYRGQLRYFNIENGFLGLGDRFPELRAHPELHLGNSAKFSAVDRGDLRLTLAHLENYHDNPFARPFRRGNLTQAKSRRFVSAQTSFLKFDPPNPKRLIAALCFGFENESDRSEPAFTEVRFADKNWQCLNDYVDLRAALLESRRVPSESVPDLRVTVPKISAEVVQDKRSPIVRNEISDALDI